MWLGILVSALVAGIPAQFGGWPLRERSTSSASLAAAASGGLDIWADDTAGVWLDDGIVTSGDGSGGGSMLWAADGNLGSNCASGPIGCTSGNNAAIPLNLSAGTYTLVIDAYQLVGGSPFGVMYDGVMYDGVLNTTVPEPASYRLMGLVLAGLGTLIRHR
jgi:hypothetical protein